VSQSNTKWGLFLTNVFKKIISHLKDLLITIMLLRSDE